MPGDENTHNDCDASLLLPADLPEFHLRWREFRPSATAMLDQVTDDVEQYETLRWLIAMADRVGESDLDGSSDLDVTDNLEDLTCS